MPSPDRLASWKIAVVIATMTTFMATCAAGIVPGNACLVTEILWFNAPEFIRGLLLKTWGTF